MKPIYKLVSIELDNEDDEYIMAISYDKQVLENMLANVKLQYTEKLCNFEIKENTKLYKLYNIDNKYFVTRIVKCNENSKLHGFNKITLFGCEQALLDVSNININNINDFDMCKNNVSTNEIFFDVYYDEGILNA